MCAEDHSWVYLKQKVQLLQDPESTFSSSLHPVLSSITAPLISHFKVLFYISILLLAVLGFHCRAQAFSSRGEWGPLSSLCVVVIAEASLVVELGL